MSALLEGIKQAFRDAANLLFTVYVILWLVAVIVHAAIMKPEK